MPRSRAFASHHAVTSSDGDTPSSRSTKACASSSPSHDDPSRNGDTVSTTSIRKDVGSGVTAFPSIE
jgi:hypothetical protein